MARWKAFHNADRIQPGIQMSFFDRITLPETFVGGGPTGDAVTFKPTVTTISTSLVYRFNWGGPSARY